MSSGKAAAQAKQQEPRPVARPVETERKMSGGYFGIPPTNGSILGASASSLARARFLN